MDPLSVQEVKNAVKGDFESLPTEEKVTGVSTDTRKVAPGDLFVALKGPRFDGHDFIPQAEEKGAAAVVCRRGSSGGSGACCIGVKDTLLALGDLAANYRRRFSTHVIGVTGSNGKTTTKEMIHHVLSAFHPTVKSDESFNNFIGLPLSIFKIGVRQKFAVLEMGTNAPGEISRLSKIARPNIAVLTCVSETHTEGLGDLDGVARAKGEITHGMADGALLVVNGDDPRCVEIGVRYGGKTFRFGFGRDADVRCTGAETDGLRTKFSLADGTVCSLPLLGRHNVMNALACLTVCQYAGVGRADITERLECFRPPRMRSTVTQAGGLTLINDSYNANPASFRAALEMLGSIEAKRRVLVCGDMLELGERSPEYHRELGVEVVRRGVGLMVCVGEAAKAAAEAAMDVGMPSHSIHTFDTFETAVEFIEGFLRKGDAVLVKGSRAMSMEVVADRIRACAERDGLEG